MEEDGFHLGALIVPPEVVAYIFCSLIAYIFSFLYWFKISSFKAQYRLIIYMLQQLAVYFCLFLFICFPAFHVLQLYIPILFTYCLTGYFRREWWMLIVNMVGILFYLSVVHNKAAFTIQVGRFEAQPKE